MKKIFTALVALFTLSAGFLYADQGVLHPATYGACLEEPTIELFCSTDSSFLHTRDGRCGCVVPMMTAGECMRSSVLCVEGASFEWLLDWEGNNVGCGCYRTEDAPPTL